MAKRKVKKNASFFILTIMLLLALVAFYFSQPIALQSVSQYYPSSVYSLERVEHQAFALGYDEELEQARWVVYPLYQENVDKPNLKRPSFFTPDPKVSTGSALHLDYTHSGYDRGHLAPNDDFNYDEELQKESFFMSNVSPQVPAFNRGEWLKLEEYTRNVARQKGDLIVSVGPIFRNTYREYIGKTNQIAVPSHFFKILYHPASGDTEAFILENSAKKQPFRQNQTSVDEIERITGLNFPKEIYHSETAMAA